MDISILRQTRVNKKDQSEKTVKKVSFALTAWIV